MSLLREAERCLAKQHAHGLNSFITPLPRAGQWLDRVKEADQRREQGNPKSAVDGRLIAIKDNICTRELRTTCASGILDKFTSPFNATVVDQLEAAGAITAGKTNLDEFGMGSHSIHSRFGPVKNSRQDHAGEDLSAGGSSGGSAVAVAAEQCYAALGTDTGGSVRLPAAYTGTVGFKPSYGLISRWGVVAYANSLDTVGILGKSTSSVRDIFSILNQYDARDPTSVSQSSRSSILTWHQTRKLSSRLTSSPLRIGVPLEYNISELTPSIRHAWVQSLAHLQEQGHTVLPISLPATKHALSAYYVLAPAEASSNLAKYDGIRYGTRAKGPDSNGQPDGYLYAKTRGLGFGDEVKRRIMLGTFSLSADAMDNYFIQAQRVRRLVQQDFNAVFAAAHPFAASQAPDASRLEAGEVDVIICPTAPSAPPRLSDLTAGSSPLDAYVNDVFTVPASLAGLPAISVPVTVSQSPQCSDADDVAGIQIIGQYGDDELVMNVAEMLEGKRLTGSL
ncbi:Glutamyl-tRNA(Gln) amidotransferase subunit A [Penicillium macrosclerotiorum]|uniref:Glutamyl-tRNA(Gln) amidotransferase subunit A n=1 Tax=Penicillium macrosclerotiorum TaxID=303699 RepID=UPI002548F3DB|nr:Glutamyl-tRNA(Gln) amidotransferase subunit A [Penicillium macrosclerotiorum]KAJ5692038.1 Glutamyl-tRNA(Gln) amidotransferase subunit A [Penicillium macrosclerotiorum]